MSLPSRAHAVSLACAAVVLAVLVAHGLMLVRQPVSPDILFLFLPNAAFLREQLLRGELPLWNPLLLAGHPFLAELQTQVLYPPSLLFLLARPERVLGPFLFAHLVWLGLGTWRLARYSGASRRAAVLAGLAASLSPLAVEHYAHPNMLCGLSWVPWVWGSGRLLARRPTRRGMALLGVQVACSVLAGSPELTLLALAGLAVSLWRRTRWTVGALALGAGLSAATWIPFLELLVCSDRRAGIGAGEASSFALSPAEVLDLVLPFVRFGADRSGTQGFQSVLFVGSSLLLLAGWGLWRRKGLAVVCAVLVLLALGDAGGLFTWLHRWVPGAGLFRFPIKFLSPLPVLLALALASGFSAWERGARPITRRPGAVFAMVGLLGACALAVAGAGAGWAVSVAWVALAGGALLASRRAAPERRGWAVAAILFVECAIFQQGVGTLASRSGGEPCRPSPAFQPGGRVAYDIDWGRVDLEHRAEACEVGIPNANMAGGFAALEGFVVPAPAYVKRLVREEPERAARQLGASVVVIDDEAKRAAYPGEVLFQNGSYLALKLGRPGRALLESGGERLELEPEVDLPSRLVFTLPRGGERLTVRDAWFPGWEAEADGEPVPLLEAEGLRAIALRGSERRVELHYRPGSFVTGLTLSLVSLGVLGLLWFRARRGG
ncbi:hypothetical protein JQX13_08540 [Archangium violaceum]|uniref:hypothetical protein n=1 Tax=Archangium violaceum TaxID=83451 RepID=UPI00193C5283|nr:hypothetical protein [Archangium violaceum]QRK10127.1 hypothetical protein JQX13_08540 [Archangium violaceum]